MAYTPREWSCGDKITADSLNNIEDGIQEALECCADKGYECTETRTSLFDGNVTTTASGGVADGAFSAYFDLPNKAVVTFNGVEYTCDGNGWGLGDDSFVAYPFYIMLGIEGSNPRLQTPNAGTYSVKVEALEESVDTSECFGKAVKRFTGFDCEYRELFEETITIGSPTFEDLSYSDLIDAEFVRVTFNGVEYGCERRVNADLNVGTVYEYGADYNSTDFSKYPFEISSNEIRGNTLYVHEPGTYTIKVEISTSNTTPCFEQAVKSVAKGALIINLHKEMADSINFLVTDKTLNEIAEAYDAGRRILIKERNTNASEAIFEVYQFYHEYDSELGEVGTMQAVYFKNESQYSTSAPYWDADPPTVYTTTYGNAGDGIGHPNFSPYLSRYYGQGIE